MNVEEAAESAIVIGAGIGGLTAAIALRQIGWTVSVLERAAALEPAGTGLAIWPNAVRALEAGGLADELRARATVIAQTGVRDPSGRWLSRTTSSQMVHRYGEPLMAVQRTDLVALLAGALPADTLQLAAPVTAVDAGSLHRSASVHCGGEVFRTGLVVGADGVGSITRHTLWPTEAPLKYSGYTTWRALVHMPTAVARDGFETWGRGERFGALPVGQNLWYVYAAANAMPGGGGADEVAGLYHRFGRWHEPIPSLLSAIDPERLLRHDVLTVRPTLPTFHHETVALVGDAAHAMEPNLGQGACQAIEDSIVLAHYLSGETPVRTALARYSAARVPRAGRLARQSRQIGRLTHSTVRPLTIARDTATRLAPPRLALRGFDYAASWHPPHLPTCTPQAQ